MKVLAALFVFWPWWLTPICAYLGGFSGAEAMRMMSIMVYLLWPLVMGVAALFLHAWANPR